jgi:hypothetical protein
MCKYEYSRLVSYSEISKSICGKKKLSQSLQNSKQSVQAH